MAMSKVSDGWSEEFTDLYQQYEETLEKLKQPDKKEKESQNTTRKEAIKKLVGSGTKTIIQATPLKNISGADALSH